MTNSLTLTTANEIAAEWLARLAAAADLHDLSAARDLFLDGGYWRDIAAFTWDLRSFAGADVAAAELLRAWLQVRPATFELDEAATRVQHRVEVGQTIETFFTFETEVAQCRGHLRLARATSGTWAAWTFFTAMDELKGHEERSGARRPRGHSGHAVSPEGPSRPAEVLVVGAGQAGLSLAARLTALGIPTVVVESNERIGDNWRKRYQSLVLHNQVWANHLPFLEFPATWPVYIGKDQLADWLEAYASLLSLDVRTSTTFTSAEYDDAERAWTVRLTGADGVVRTERPRHVVLATGVFGPPNRPQLSGESEFAGTVMHAVDYRGGKSFAGERVLVVGSGSSAHDVAQDLYLSGAQVTMLQRSSTCVVSLEPGAARAYAIYREDGAPLEEADLVSNSFPFSLLAQLHQEMTREIAEMDSELIDGLRAAGFALDFGDDGSGFLMKHQRSGGGYYINVGCSDLIVDGKISIVQGVTIVGMESSTVRFTDDSAADFDRVVVAAGYRNMSESIRMFFGGEVAQRVGDVWGLDGEGELRAMWRPTGQPGFWIMGGSLQQARPFSKYLAMQIKADLEGLVSGPPKRLSNVRSA
jgi:cation diffusion facilitator CzcD-associated flavoprotein CzcO